MKKVKDIFIDNNIAKDFANPPNSNYQDLMDWLIKKHKNPENNAFLVLSKKLLNEYYGSMTQVKSAENIIIIVKTLTEEGRIQNFTLPKIKEFKRKHYKKRLETSLDLKRLGKDREHIPIILLSCRKYALILDNKFINAIKNFPKFKATAEKKPENLPYKTGKPNC